MLIAGEQNIARAPNAARPGSRVAVHAEGDGRECGEAAERQLFLVVC